MSEKASANQVWAIRAAACELLALSLRYPSSELSAAVFSGEWLDAVEEIAAALGIAAPGELRHDSPLIGRGGVPAPDEESFRRELQAEATRLFVGPPNPIASPYEGAWRAGDDNVPALLYVNPHSQEVEDFTRKCGLRRPLGSNEPLDLIDTELELLQYLSSIEAGLVKLPESGPLPEAFPGGSPARAFAMFLDNHALAWMPRFAGRIASASRLPYYSHVAWLLENCLKSMA